MVFGVVHMKRLSLILIIFILSCFFFNYIFKHSVDQYKLSSIFRKPVLDKQIPAGVISKAFSISQPFTLTNKELEKYQHFGSLQVFVGVFAATYARKNNIGHIKLKLSNKQQSWTALVDVSSIEDNKMLYVPMPGCKFLMLQPGKYLLTIEGVDSPLDKGATVWLTKNIPYGKLIHSPHAGEYGLVFSLYLKKVSAKPVIYFLIIGVYLLTIIGCAIPFVYFNNDISKNNTE